MIDSQVRVAILEDHQGIIDGYMYRLSTAPEICVVGSASWGEELDPLLSEHPADVLLLDINVPASPENRNPFPVLHLVPSLLKKYPGLHILAISGLTQNTLIEALIEAGVCGYIFKDDQASIQQLAKIVLMAASGGVYFSQGAYQSLRGNTTQANSSPLTLRQMEILSICAAYPDVTTSELAARLGIASSTLRNLLSGAYLRLDVRTRAAAIAKARQMGLLADSDSSDLKKHS
jgi:two-component system nitrate/nitrite response regulator NarL